MLVGLSARVGARASSQLLGLRVHCAIALCLCLGACSSATPQDVPQTGGAVIPTGMDPSGVDTTQSPSTPTGEQPPAPAQMPAQPQTPAEPPDEEVVLDCTDLQVQAEPVARPVDVIWVVDNSGSMDGEASAVGTNLVGFADTMEMSGLDYHVVLISQAGFVPEYAALQTTLPADRFRFVDTNVRSQDGLDDLLGTYNDYRDFLRPTAVTHFVAVTDDEARGGRGFLGFGGDVNGTRDWFLDEMRARLRKDFVFHSVASEVTGNNILGQPRGCAGSANPGRVYYALSDQTGGEKWSICTSDWSGLFSTLGTAVEESSGVACSLPMPEPPGDLPLNPEQVTITLTDGSGGVSDLMRVANGDACATGDWHYDRPLLPNTIELCEAACTAIQDDPGARIDVTVACGSNACAGVGTQADIFSTPVDIVWVIDNSGSMDDEADKISSNVGAFADTIEAAGIDFQVIFLTDADEIGLGIPIGDRFKYVEIGVGSHNALMQAVDQFPAYRSLLRPGAIVHFVVVTDDETDVPGGLDGAGSLADSDAERAATAQWFADQMTAPERLGRAFTLHSIVGEVDGDCAASSNSVANVGQTYIDLANQNGGRIFDICTDDWTPLFNTLAEAVLSSAPVDCTFALPEPPDGQVFVADEVNVRFAHEGASQPTVVGRTPGPEACDAGGWHYDDESAPTSVQLCPVTCQEVQGLLGAAVEIQFGCDSELVPIL